MPPSWKYWCCVIRDASLFIAAWVEDVIDDLVQEEVVIDVDMEDVPESWLSSSCAEVLLVGTPGVLDCQDEYIRPGTPVEAIVFTSRSN